MSSDDVFGDTGSNHPLVGKAFHIFVEGQPAPQKQGVVLQVFNSTLDFGQLALVQYFEWFMGDLSTMAVLRIVDLVSDVSSGKRVNFYANCEDMKDYYDARWGKARDDD